MPVQHTIESALSAVNASACDHVLLRRNGRFFMALPVHRGAAKRTLKLYQPQRPKAVLAMRGVRLLAALGLHRIFLPKLDGFAGKVTLDPDFPGCLAGTAGGLLGSPEHRVQRAILSYQTEHGWEVAKLAFGEGGRAVIDGEYEALNAIPTGTPGIPQTLGVHHGNEFSILRLPYLDGDTLVKRQGMRGMELLESWLCDLAAKPACDFPEWSAITAALETSDAGKRALVRLAARRLRPVIRHGDFARWNLLRRKDGTLVAIDWEWGHPEGMPGIDLVHLFAQDARLVQRLAPDAVVRAVEHELSATRCRQYLQSVGWEDAVRDVIVASIAFTVGTKQQDNERVLEEILNVEF